MKFPGSLRDRDAPTDWDIVWLGLHAWEFSLISGKRAANTWALCSEYVVSRNEIKGLPRQ